MLDWESVDTVLLDMDGTLLDLHFDNHFWLEHLPLRYAGKQSIPFDQAQQEIVERTNAERGKLNWYCLDYWSNELGMDIAELKQETAHLINFRPDVPDFLRLLQETRHRVVLVTNAHRKVLDIKLARTDLGNHLDRIVSSHDFKAPKEDQAFWKTLQTVEPFDPKRTVLIDDSLPVLRSAREYGIAQLLCVTQPDSKKPAQDPEEFAGLSEFRDIWPGQPRNS